MLKLFISMIFSSLINWNMPKLVLLDSAAQMLHLGRKSAVLTWEGESRDGRNGH